MWAHRSADRCGITWDTAQGLHFRVLRVEGGSHAGWDMVMIHLVGWPSGKLRAGQAVGIRAGRGTEIIGRNAQAAFQLVFALGWGWITMAAGMEIRQTAMQCGGGDIGGGQSVHGSKILGGEITTESAEWRTRSAAGTRSSVTGRVQFAVQLIELVFAIERRSLLRKVVDCSLGSLGGLVDQVVVVVDREIRGDEDGDREGGSQLLSVSISIDEKKSCHAHLADMTVGVQELDPEFQLMPDLDALSIGIL